MRETEEQWDDLPPDSKVVGNDVRHKAVSSSGTACSAWRTRWDKVLSPGQRASFASNPTRRLTRGGSIRCRSGSNQAAGVSSDREETLHPTLMDRARSIDWRIEELLGNANRERGQERRLSSSGLPSL